MIPSGSQSLPPRKPLPILAKIYAVLTFGYATLFLLGLLGAIIGALTEGGPTSDIARVVFLTALQFAAALAVWRHDDRALLLVWMLTALVGFTMLASGFRTGETVLAMLHLGFALWYTTFRRAIRK